MESELTLMKALLGFGARPYGYSVSMGEQFAYAGRLTIESAPLAIGVAVVWFVIAYFGNQTIIDMATGSAPVEPQGRAGPLQSPWKTSASRAE